MSIFHHYLNLITLGSFNILLLCLLIRLLGQPCSMFCSCYLLFCFWIQDPTIVHLTLPLPLDIWKTVACEHAMLPSAAFKMLASHEGACLFLAVFAMLDVSFINLAY